MSSRAAHGHLQAFINSIVFNRVKIGINQFITGEIVHLEGVSVLVPECHQVALDTLAGGSHDRFVDIARGQEHIKESKVRFGGRYNCCILCFLGNDFIPSRRNEYADKSLCQSYHAMLARSFHPVGLIIDCIIPIKEILRPFSMMDL
eukprot:scaffold14137_cov110-Amphora_coffeaeformis.AAC.1